MSDHIAKPSWLLVLIVDDFSGLSEAIRHQVRELHNRALTQDCRDIITWLSPLNFWSKQNDVFNGRLEGTGEWLLEDKVFKDWLTGTQRTLWCPGMRIASQLNTLNAAN